MWDDADVCRLTWAAFSPTVQGIVSAPVDLTTGALLEEPRQLWQGTGLAHAEGPHLYRIDGWWYVLVAEGGTERGHTSAVARARSLEGPFESAPANPILTHRSTAHSVQSVGHADLVELQDGSWAAVHLGVRPRGQTPLFHVNGRETFLVGIDWVDGWPIVDETRFAVPAADHSFVDRFEGLGPDSRWIAPGSFPSSFTRAVDGGLEIDAETGVEGAALLATRVPDIEWSVEARFTVESGAGRLVLRIDGDHSYELTYDGDTVQATLQIGPALSVVGEIDVTAGTTPALRISARLPERGPYVGPDEPDLIEMSFIDENGDVHEFGRFDGRYLSTEVAGGFTGRVVGVEALSGQLVLNSFQYSTLDEADGK
jgi:hypothetical protein